LRRQYLKMPWREMAGLRDILINNYFSVDNEIVWNVVEKELPTLKEQIIDMLNDYRLVRGTPVLQRAECLWNEISMKSDRQHPDVEIAGGFSLVAKLYSPYIVISSKGSVNKL